MTSTSKSTVEVGCIRQVPTTSTGSESDSEGEVHPPDAQDDSSDDEYDTDVESDFRREPSQDDTSQGRGIYYKACSNLGLVPCSPFLRQLLKAEMSLMHYNLGPRGAEAVAVALMQNTKVLTLNISYNDIKEEGAIYISKMLTENFYITELDISNNDLQSQGAYAVSEMLRQNSDILEVNLSGNKFIEKDVEPIVEAMKENYTLKSLNLSHNSFCEIGGQLLGPAIDANVGLEYLNLRWNQLRRKGAVAIGYGLRHNCALKSLDISWNGFADDGAKSVGEAIALNSTLIELDISNNRISGIGAAHIASGLLKNSTLQILRIGKNPLLSQGAYDILAAVQSNPECAIEELGFEDIPVNAEFEDLLEDVLEMRPNLSVQCGAAMRGKDRVKKIKKKVDVLNLLLEYIELRGLRMVDFFRQLDKDGSKKITRAEFMAGVKKTGIPMTRRQLKKLVNILDTDNDGNIDYSEMVAIKSDDVFDVYHKKNLKKDDPSVVALKDKKMKQKRGHK